MVRLIKTLRTALNADLKHMHIYVLTGRRKKGLKKQKQLKDDIRKMIQEKRIDKSCGKKHYSFDHRIRVIMPRLFHPLNRYVLSD